MKYSSESSREKAKEQPRVAFCLVVRTLAWCAVRTLEHDVVETEQKEHTAAPLEHNQK